MQKSFDAGNVKLTLLVTAVSAIALALDLSTKYLVKNHVLPQGSYFFGWLSFTSHQNFGLVGDLKMPFMILIAINLAAFAALAYGLYWAWDKRSNCQLVFLGLILGGALGNFYDRLVQGYVFDWILLFNTSVINLADVWITLGIIGYLLCLSTAGPESKNADGHVNCQTDKTRD